ncbi:bifunctional sugar phosphate isomerase/epimerase/4-hydroxyphenylpyruvate dioxygenase family protein [Devosia sp.]|uniref:bifunctional sugar phosphate isomerase/epimerase/4-hydroxyphenylpyruvate dioxygenase family protein n=1 Tax=Devosia sp. TaxID=1871048 RepID=UPI0035AE3973
MKSSIATVSISGDLGEKLEAIAAAGFDGVEIFESDFLAFGAAPAEVGRMARDLGLEITLFQPFRDFEGLPEPLRGRAFERARHKFALMNELGTGLMLVCSNVSPAALGGIDRAAADFRQLGELAQKFGVRVGFEALAWGRHVSDHRDAWEVVRRADHPHVGLILDSFHTLSRRIPADSIRSIPGDRIFMVQLADAPRIDMDLLYWSRHFRNMPGEGDLPVVDFMRAVAATGYAGPLSLEIFNDQFRGGSPRAISVDGQRSLLSLMDEVNRVEPGPGLSPPPMPDRVPVEAVSFVEFAADEEEAEQLSLLLAGLGFVRAGRHRSKSVSLYRQGDINIVVNTEREGLAYASWVTHGTSAYAIGLKVADARATVQRARVLGAQPFEQAVAEGELRIPAIRGVGGGVIYLLDASEGLGRVWETEFVAEAEPATGGGLTHIDHIAQTMNSSEMLTWVLFYRSIFATEKSPMVDVPDPSGLVRSLVIENADGSLRLTLNGVENSRTLAGHFVTRTFGSSVQHLCFACSDIFAAAERMSLQPLAIGDTYYDDLEARFGLEPDFIARLRRHNILYDRDDRGEFFQFYSQMFGEGFFFEVVERRDGYRGYGAPNAPFRIAAQKRGLGPLA